MTEANALLICLNSKG